MHALPKEYTKKVMPNRGTVVHHRDFPQILDSSTAGMKPVNSRYGSWVAKTFVDNGLVTREKKDRSEIIITSKISGDIHFQVGDVETWFRNALLAREAMKGAGIIQFEKPLGYSDSGNGSYYSLHYPGEPLSTAQYKIKMDEEQLLGVVRGIAMMHANGVYHSHLFTDNIVVTQPEDPLFVVVDPKFLIKDENVISMGIPNSKQITPKTTSRKEKIQHDLFQILVMSCRILEGAPPKKTTRFVSFLTEVEREYQRANKVPGDILDGKFFSTLMGS